VYAAERQQLLAERLQADGRLSVAGLAGELSVSSETIRRDLAVLERDGLAQRVHGGAVASRALTILEPGRAQRTTAHSEQKLRIARAAMDLLPAENGSVALDAGSTIGQFVDQIPFDRPLTIVTHAIPIAAKLTGISSVNLHMLGGRVHGGTAAAFGQTMIDSLAGLHVDVCFLATDAVTPEHGLSTPDVEEAAAKRALVKSARTVVVLADSSKFSGEHVFSFATYDDLDVFVTDDGISRDDIDALEAHDVKVVVA
jgi:DeoR family fructose operon transcriptional repressor